MATVLHHINNRRVLFACVQVNRLWFEEATTCLWKNKPPVATLLKLASRERQQYYASKILQLNCSKVKSEIHRQLTHLNFSRLTDFTNVDNFGGIYHTSRRYEGEGDYLLQYLQPALRTLRCQYGVSDSLLDCISVSLTRLVRATITLTTTSAALPTARSTFDQVGSDKGHCGLFAAFPLCHAFALIF